MANTNNIDTTSDTKDETNSPAEKQPAGDCLIVFPNPEKKAKFRLGLEEYMPMSSSRILLSGMPGSGKRNVILNLIHRMMPKPSVVHLVHCDPHTIEYDCISEAGMPLLVYEPSDFPTIENIDHPDILEQSSSSDSSDEDESEGADNKPKESKKDKKKPDPLQNPLVIIDEVTSDQLGKIGASRFERMVNHVATHRNTTVVCSIQSLLNIPPRSRRAFNHFVLWKQADKAVDQMAANRSGIPYEILYDMFGLCRDPHDFIWIDLDTSHDDTWRYRLDMISPIIIEPVVPKH